MLKKERQETILNLLNEHPFITAEYLVDHFNVTPMTIQRDLNELDSQHLLIRVRGGAQSITYGQTNKPLTRFEKLHKHSDEKHQIAQRAVREIKEGDTIFLGASTTIELMVHYLTVSNIRILTNSLDIFKLLINDSRYELILIGGSYLEYSGAFVGTIANDSMKNLHVQKAFIGANAVLDGLIYNANESEGTSQRIILEASEVRYILADSHKLDTKDFYPFFTLDEASYLITDKAISPHKLKKYSRFITILN